MTPANVQIRTASPERRQKWRSTLESAGLIVAESLDGPFDEACEVLLIDLTHLTAELQTGITAGCEQGVVQVGSARAAAENSPPLPSVELIDIPTVRLGEQSSPGEVALACLLLVQVVRLLKKQRAASRREAQWKELADIDPLTGLLNRRAFEERLVEGLQTFGTGSCCLALLDLDRFKPINDIAGHPAGDRLLQEIAQRLSSTVRKGDLVCRLGGDEFVIALFDAPVSLASKLVDRLRRTVGELHHPQSGGAVTASAGWAMVGGSGDEAKTAAERAAPHLSFESLYRQALEAADANLRQAKLTGRDRTIPS